MPEQLEDSIRATAPQPREAYVQRLERRVEEGFAKPKKQRSPWFLKPAAPLVVVTLFAVVAVGGAISMDNGSDDEMGGGGSSGSAMETQSGSSAAAPAPDAADGHFLGPQGAAPRSAQPGGASPTAPGPNRSVETRTQLELRTGADEFGEVTAGILRVADTTGTVVQRSDVSERGGRGFATYDLRVPSSRLDEVLADLSRLADVTARSAASEDITGAVVSARARLEDARGERRALLRALERAQTEPQRDAIRERLRDTRLRIARAERDVRRLRGRVDRSRVDVTVRSTGEAGAWTPGDAVDDAGRVLEVALGVIVVAGAVLLPFAALLGLAALAAALTRRRRREAALG